MEIDSLIVRLIGDNTALIKTLKDAAKEHHELLAAVEAETKKMTDAHRASGVAISAETEKTMATLQKMSVVLDATYQAGGMSVREYEAATKKLGIEVAATAKVITDAVTAEAEWKRKGEEATKKYRSAQEIFNETQIKYQELLSRGKIEQETYNRAITDAQKVLEQSQVVVKKLTEDEKKDLELKKQGEAIARKYMTAQELFDEEMERHCLLLEKGAYDQKIFGNEVEQSLNKLEANKVKVSSLSDVLHAYGKTMVYVGGAIAGVFGLMINRGVDAAAQYETTVASFKTMIGTLAETEKTMSSLSAFAVEAPMSMPQIEQAAMGLIQFGERGEQMVKTLGILGDAAAGTGTHFNLLSSVFNQVRGVGHLLTGDFRQLSTRGVLSLQDIAKHFEVTEAAAGKMLSTGKISFQSFKSILENLSKEGGRFHNMMLDQSKTFEGQSAKLGDAVNIAIRDIGQKFLPVAKMLLNAANSIVDQWKNVPESLKTTAAVIMGLTFSVGTVVAAIGGWVLIIPKVIEAYKWLDAILILHNARLKAVQIASWDVSVVSIKAAYASASAWVTAAAPVAAAWMVAFAPILAVVAAVSLAIAAFYIIQKKKLAEIKAEVDETIKNIKPLAEREKKETIATIKASDVEIAKQETQGGDKKAVAYEAQRQGLSNESNKIQKERNLYKGIVADAKLYKEATWGLSKAEIASLDGTIAIAEAKLSGLDTRYGLLKDKIEEYDVQLESIKESGVSAEVDEANTQRNTGMKKEIRSLGVRGGEGKLFDPSGARADAQHLAEMKFEGFNDSRIEEARKLQDKVRKESANDELRSLKEKADLEISLIGLTNKELLRKKYTGEGLSKLQADNLANLQFELEMSKQLNEIEEKNRTIGKTPHQIRKDKAEREGATPEAMGIVDSIRDAENQGTIIGMEEQLKLMLLTNEQRVIAKMIDDEALQIDIDKVKVLQEQLKEKTKVAAATNNVRSQNEALPDEIRKLKIANMVIRQNNELWGYQKKIREDMLALEEMRQQKVPEAEIEKNRKLREEQTEEMRKAELIAKGASVREDLKTPDEKLKEELKRLQDTVDSGALSKDEAAQQASKLIDQNLKSTIDARPENSGTVVGSREYAKKERDRDGATETKQEKLLKTQTLLQGTNNELTQKIITQLEKTGGLARARN